MSVFEQYIRLEATGIWREGPGVEPREVLVQFGNATLVLTGFDEQALGHWALAGVQILDEQNGAVVYAMNTEGSETLTISDPDMIGAIASVSRVPARPAPVAAPRRRRPYLGLALVLLIAAGLAAFGPDTIRGQAKRMIPKERAEELGDRMLLGLMEAGGTLCVNAQGQRALDRLGAQITGGPAPRLRVLDLGVPAATLPGPAILIGRDTVAQATDISELAGWILLGLERDPVDDLVTTIGMTGNLRYILTGEVGAQDLSRTANTALRPPTQAEAEAALAALAALGLETKGFSGALGNHGIRAPGPAQTMATPPDNRAQDWLQIRSICD